MQDRTGYLWIGTWAGASHFDGRRFQTVGAYEGLQDELISAIAADDDGAIWLGTESGHIAHWDSGKISAPPWRTLPSDPVHALWPSPTSSGLWIGYESGLWRCEGQNCEKVTSDSVVSIHPSRSGTTAWLASASGVWRLTDSKAETVPLPDCAPQCFVTAIAEGSRHSQQQLWIGLVDGRLLELSAGQLQIVWQGQERIRALYATDENLWIGTYEGLFLMEPQGVRRIKLRPSTDRELISVLYEDHEGSLWVGTWGDGLYQSFARGITEFTLETGLPDLSVWAFLETPDGCLWMAGHSSGVFQLCGEEWTKKITLKDGLPGNRVRALALGKDGSVWVGTTQGLARLAGNEVVETWTATTGLPENYVRDIAVDEEGSVWVATRKRGLARFYLGNWEDWGLAQGLPAQNLRSLALGRDGKLWIASDDGGVISFDGTRFSSYGLDQGLPHLRTWCVMVDSNDRIWVGTDRGVWLFTPGSLSKPVVISREHGLPHSVVLSLVEDREGAVWVGTMGGVARLLPDGRVSHVFSASDGLTDTEATLTASLVDSKGSVWLGMAVGVSMIQPETFIAERLAPHPILTGMLVNNHPLDYSEIPIGLQDRTSPMLELSPKENDIEFRFAVLTFRAPGKVRYRWLLAGHDEDWTLAQTEDRALYRHLQPGVYRFRLAAHNGDGAWVESPMTLVFSLRPPWFRTSIFYAFCLFAIGLTFFAAHRLRIGRLKRRGQELELAVAERSRELSAALKDLEILSMTDPLTKLHNRRFFSTAINREIARVQRVFSQTAPCPNRDLLFFMIDIDHFKPVNDRFGHEAGDRVLVEAARRITTACRQTDLVVRWGGEEFLVVAPGMDRDFGDVLARRILECFLASKFQLGDRRSVACTCSVGWTPYPMFPDRPEVGTWEKALLLADSGLYLAKQEGRNRSVGVLLLQEATELTLDRLGESLLEADGVFVHLTHSFPSTKLELLDPRLAGQSDHE